jgi:hypothetical protein
MYKLLLVTLVILLTLTGCVSSKINVVSEVQPGKIVDKDIHVYIDKTFVKTEDDRKFIENLEMSLREHNFKLSNEINKNTYLFSYRVREGGGMEKVVVPVTSFSTGSINNTSFTAMSTSYAKKNKLFTVKSINMSISAYANNKVVELWVGRIMLSDGVNFEGNEKSYIDDMITKLSKNVEISQQKLKINKSIKSYRGCVIGNIHKLSDAGKLLDEITYRVTKTCNGELINFVNTVSAGKSNAYRNSFYESASNNLPNEIRNDYYKYMDSKK